MLRRLLILFVIGYLLAFNSLSASARTLVGGWELWYPYQYRDKQQHLVGLDIEIFNAIIKQAGVQVSFTELPWERHLMFIKEGKMDVAMGASYNNVRKSYAYFTEPYRQETIKLFIRRKYQGHVHIQNLTDLINSNYLIGVEGGYYYGEQYQRLIQRLDFRTHINEVLDIEQNVLMLMKDRIDGVLVDPVTMQSFIKKYRLQNELIALPLTVYQTNIHIMLSKKTTDLTLLDKFNRAILRLKANGTIKKIEQRWTANNNLSAL